MNTNTDLSTIKLWFERAVSNPTDKNRAVQIGCHFEEVAEMVTSLGACAVGDDIETVSNSYKKHQGIGAYDEKINRKELLDALCDQIVTAVGVAHMFGLDISGALNEVNRSNFSKFVDGKPLFNEQGKIIKGPKYTPPNLEPYL